MRPVPGTITDPAVTKALDLAHEQRGPATQRLARRIATVEQQITGLERSLQVLRELHHAAAAAGK
jgi:hypothetical protein